MVLNWEQMCPPGDNGQCLKTFLMGRGRSLLLPSSGFRLGGAAKHPSRHRVLTPLPLNSQQRMIQSKQSVVLRLKNLAIEPYVKLPIGLLHLRVS